MKFELELEIDRDPETIFDFMVDQDRKHLWLSGVTPDGAAPTMARGARWTEHSRNMGRTFDITLECTDFDRPNRFGLRTLEPFRSGQVITLSPSSRGTRLHVVGGGEVSGFFKLAGPVLAAFFTRKFQQDYARLKAAVEAAPVAAAGGGRHDG